MTDADNRCKYCGSTDENFDPDYCSLDCYFKHMKGIALYRAARRKMKD